MNDQDHQEIRPGEFTDIERECCLAVTTIVMIVLAAVITLICMEAAGPLLLSDLQNLVENNRENRVAIYTLRHWRGQQFWTVEFLQDEEEA